MYLIADILPRDRHFFIKLGPAHLFIYMQLFTIHEREIYGVLKSLHLIYEGLLCQSIKKTSATVTNLYVSRVSVTIKPLQS